ncbi:MAG TPA: hypothetical protein VGA91_02890 [Candidatus Limnocylindria bacterium]|jgi:hypothetical protein
MTDAAWRQMAARLSWVTAGTFLVASVVVLLLSFNVTAAEPTFAPDATFVDNILASFEDQQARWIQDLGSSLLFAVGFAAIAALGATLRHVLGRDDPRTMLTTATFLLAGAIGIASQLIYIGGTEVATNPQYCDCDYLAEEVISRAMIRDVINGISFWMIDGFSVLFAVGLIAVASVSSAAGSMPAAWLAFTRLVAIAGLASVVWNRVAIPLLIQAGYQDLDYGRIGSIILFVVAGILVPVWAAWLARALGTTSAEPAT